MSNANTEPTNLVGMYKRLRRNTDSEFYKDLISLLEFRLDIMKTELIECASVDDYRKLQGRASELKEMLSHLQRKPVKSQRTGAYGS